jgi:hypothetical protein
MSSNLYVIGNRKLANELGACETLSGLKDIDDQAAIIVIWGTSNPKAKNWVVNNADNAKYQIYIADTDDNIIRDIENVIVYSTKEELIKNLRIDVDKEVCQPSESSTQTKPFVRVEPHNLAPMVIVSSGTGGMGKTTTSLTLAQRVAELMQENGRSDFKVILIDGNIKQNSVSKALGLNRSGQHVTTTLDVARKMLDITTPQERQQAIDDCIIKPNWLNLLRPKAWNKNPPYRFATVLSPDASLYDEDLVTPSLYNAIITYSRQIADFVILDTEEIKTGDINIHSSNEFTDMILPQLKTDNAYLLGIFGQGDSSLTEHLKQTLDKMWTLYGIGKDAVFVKAARIQKGIHPINDNQIQELYPNAHFIGVEYESEIVRGLLQQGGIIPHDNLEVSKTLDVMIRKVLGHQDIFNSDMNMENKKDTRKKGWKFWEK